MAPLAIGLEGVFPDLRVGDRLQIGFDLSDTDAWNHDTVQSVAFSAAVRVGLDANPAALFDGAPWVIDGKRFAIWVAPQVAGVHYDIVAQVQGGSNFQTLLGVLRVLP